MLGDLFSKLQEARQKIDEAKKNLNSIVIEVESADGAVKVKANANKTITSIEISDTLLNVDKSEFQNLLLKTINNALEEAAIRGELEMKEITKDVLPNFPGLV
jgi:nucleoid-associated protein EbfC